MNLSDTRNVVVFSSAWKHTCLERVLPSLTLTLARRGCPYISDSDARHFLRRDDSSQGSHSPGPSTYRSHMSDAMDGYGMKRVDDGPDAIGEDLDPRARLAMMLKTASAKGQILEAADHQAELEKIIEKDSMIKISASGALPEVEGEVQGSGEEDEDGKEGEGEEGRELLEEGDETEEQRMLRLSGWIPDPDAGPPPTLPSTPLSFMGDYGGRLEGTGGAVSTPAEGGARGGWFGSPVPPHGDSPSQDGEGQIRTAAQQRRERAETATTLDSSTLDGARLPTPPSITSESNPVQKLISLSNMRARKPIERPVFVPTARQVRGSEFWGGFNDHGDGVDW